MEIFYSLPEQQCKMLKFFLFYISYCHNAYPIDPKYWDGWVCSNNTDPDQMQHSAFCCIWSGSSLFATHPTIFSTHQQVVEWPLSNFRTRMLSSHGAPMLSVNMVHIVSEHLTPKGTSSMLGGMFMSLAAIRGAGKIQSTLFIPTLDTMTKL